jgi:hypothetical protein
MTTMPASPACETPSKRPWHRLHLSTWVVIFLLAGLFAIVEVPGEAQYDMIAEGFSISGGGGMVFGETFSHGWPWEYLTRYEGACLVGTVEVPWLAPRAWKIFRSSQSREFSLLDAALDLAVCLAIIAAIAVIFELRRRKRTRLFQFTLRELLFLMLITAGVLSWWRTHHNQRIHEQAIVDRFEKDGVWGIFWSDEYRGPRILAKLFGENLLSDLWSYTECQCDCFEDQPIYAECFSGLKNFPHLEKISFESSTEGGACVTDELLLQIASLKNIRCLELYSAKITDAGMETIARFTRLDNLNLAQTAITSRGVQCLQSTPKLEELSLAATKIDDDAAETLGSLENLINLDVSHTKLTDKAVPHLGRLSQLYYLDISDTQISEKGYLELKALLPDCEISYK